MKVRILKYLTLVLVLLSVLHTGCTNDVQFTVNPDCTLSFSADTVRMDTVFTGQTSASASLMIYNQNNAAIRTDVVLAGGTSSPFRVNIDGEGGHQIAGLELLKGDSLFCFVSVNIPASAVGEPFKCLDSLLFIMESGVVQRIILEADGQNAVRLQSCTIGSDKTLTAQLPYIVTDTLRVMPGATLTLMPGTRLFFHQKAVLDVQGRIVACGTKDSMILMRGDRLDDMLRDLPYDLLSGQWGGIVLGGDSYDNLFSHCDIHGGTFGIRADSSACDGLKFRMHSSVLHNVDGNGIEASGCRIEVANSQITNAGAYCVDLAGGKADFAFCTIASFSIWNVGKGAVRITDSRGTSRFNLETATFRDCIITGRHTDEWVVELPDSVSRKPLYSVSNSLVMTMDTTNTHFHDVVFENGSHGRYGPDNFKNNTLVGYRSEFRLDSLSRARGIADTLSLLWPVDLAGVPRPQGRADAGCYQFVPKK